LPLLPLLFVCLLLEGEEMNSVVVLGVLLCVDLL